MKPSEELRLAKINAKLGATKLNNRDDIGFRRELLNEQHKAADEIQYKRHQGSKEMERRAKRFLKTPEGKRYLEEKYNI